MNPNSLVSIDGLTKEQILDLLQTARYFEEHPNHKILDGKVVATLFFEPSTRTRLSFETAVNRLGGRVIGFSDASTTSSSKGETLKDTIKMVSNYVLVFFMVIFYFNQFFENFSIFYGNEKFLKKENDIQLISYTTHVAGVKDGKPYINGFYSATTSRHIKEFFLQMGYNVSNRKDILALCS